MEQKIETPKKKSGLKKKLIWLGVLVVLLILITSGDSSSKSENTAVSEMRTEVAREVERAYSVGDITSVGQSLVMVNKVEFSQGGQYTKPNSGNEWMNINITIENVSSSQQYITTLGQMFVRDDKGNSYQVAVTDKSLESVNNNLDGSIIAHSKRTGWVGFEIPKGSTGLEFQYNDSSWGGKSVKINLGR